MSKLKKVITVNGDHHEVSADSSEPLLWILRDRLGLTGTKYGCGEGACGTCTVLIDGKAERSCLVPFEDLEARQAIVTIEGLDREGELSPVQQAFVEHNAFACGYCTSGMIMQATDLLTINKNPSRSEIIEAMNDNLCRCATYPSIITAIESVGQETGRESEDQS
ncbi:MAG: (2Fe-2S)-binding protein [Acidobacteria bacterium]|nr:MAG: (2Fe-2S)-binding protein [Acidobacteriota bacterium]